MINDNDLNNLLNYQFYFAFKITQLLTIKFIILFEKINDKLQFLKIGK